MRKPEVDFRQFRLNRINEPQFSHLKLLIAWVFYYTSHILTENLIPAEKCHEIYSPLDNMFTFCEWFFIPYAIWYVLIPGILAYFAIYDVDSFKKFQTYIIITQIGAVLVYIFYPNFQDLRPNLEELGRDNILIDCIGGLYSIDTNTGVFPSLHCAYSIAMASVCFRAKSVAKVWKWVLAVTALMICLSTAFIKQHSILDFFGAIVLCLLAEALVFLVIFKKKQTNQIVKTPTA